MADNLPRPTSSGPWEAYEDDVLATYRGRIETLAMLDGDGTDDPVADAEAIAALPERIRRMDAVRAEVDRLNESVERMVEKGSIYVDTWQVEMLGKRLRALLDGEGVS